jgi:hypothetical protein
MEKKMTTQNLKNEIMKLNREELNEIINAVRTRRSDLNSKAMSLFSTGMQVKFNKRNGVIKLGTIIKIGRTRALVDTGVDKYKVPFSLLLESMQKDTEMEKNNV